ncbi:Ldb7p NDAI_0A03340 [Naumovozyma dairenensis CBS 421]|uniref:Uncharacterized protein n=1 Tax=Naumovozyma dairenensis (strain ATCC 10597 / BCRC 20456 / CBS 421 / NBRC 0211 / NRRL Y-12639) TaxID=1071378 RepID=G0W3V3_NAUDC|nr:hypothetical protein NDAI_0A03340 [Naumovozyma dairenensis CBS 421]CCD22491.1 hypothetical protein NDAI_0A03340 [Naumovozyma dairenensis CBS 421]
MNQQVQNSITPSSLPVEKNTITNSYYDVISGLAALERSHQITFSQDELLQLTENSKKVRKSKNEKRKIIDTAVRPTIHSYLGGTINVTDKTNYDVSHTLLGNHVPKSQLETLSSIDFAQLFHKYLSCEDVLQIHDIFFSNSFPNTFSSPPVDIHNEDTNKEGEKAKVRKVIICKRCNSRFTGRNRMSLLKKHTCNNRRRH